MNNLDTQNAVCDDCGTSGGIFYDPVSGKSRTCHCFEEKRRAATVALVQATSEIPPLYAAATLDSFVAGSNAKQLAICRRYAAAPDIKNIGLTLVGSVGTGKTHLAVAILKERLLFGTEGRFMPVYALLNTLRTAEREEQRRLIADMYEVDFLVLDELGTDKGTDWVISQLHAILDTRINNCLPTLITSNLDNNQLKDYLSQRLYSRLMSVNKVIYLTGKDYRSPNFGILNGS